MLTQTQFNPSNETLEYIDLLETVLLDPNSSVIRNFVNSNEFEKLIPEWKRIRGKRNIQHIAHHFTLDEHTLRVIDKIKSSSYYKTLTDYQKFLTVLAGLLHDIDKNTGPFRLRGKILNDRLHPVKSAEMSRKILTRIGFPPKTVQRVYTLIHHHQAFGRLFMLYGENKAPEEFINTIALKIRSILLLECLLALSEGDIKAVQKKDAFYTPPVAELLSDYSATVRKKISLFHMRVAMFPQNLVLQKTDFWKLNLDKSACFVLCADNWSTLFEKLEKIQWGGATVLAYLNSLKEIETYNTTCAALIRFLPENIAYWGPSPFPKETNHIYSSNMALFYGLLTGDQLYYSLFLSLEEKQTLIGCLKLKHELTKMLETVSRKQGYENWHASCRAFEEGWFEPSIYPLPLDPLLQECGQSYKEVYGNQSAIGVGTRPILMGFYSDIGMPDIVPESWQDIPFFDKAGIAPLRTIV